MHSILGAVGTWSWFQILPPDIMSTQSRPRKSSMVSSIRHQSSKEHLHSPQARGLTCKWDPQYLHDEYVYGKHAPEPEVSHDANTEPASLTPDKEPAYVLSSGPGPSSTPRFCGIDNDGGVCLDLHRVYDVGVSQSCEPVGAGHRRNDRAKADGVHLAGLRNAKPGKTFHCSVVGCEYQGTFRRQYELARHLKGQHFIAPFGGDKHFYKCADIGCPLSAKLWTRVDKFRRHIRQTHPNARADEHVKL